jgi:hypothetical protein
MVENIIQGFYLEESAEAVGEVDVVVVLAGEPAQQRLERIARRLRRRGQRIALCQITLRLIMLC